MHPPFPPPLNPPLFLPRHIIIQHKITIVSLTIHFSDTNTARFFDLHLILDTKTTCFWVRTFFFGLHLILDTKTTLDFGWRPFFLFLFGLNLISDTKSAVDFEHKTLGEFPEKVRTRQNFCAQRAQKFRRNIEWPPARLENWLSQYQTDWRPNLKVFFTDFSLKTKKKKKVFISNRRYFLQIFVEEHTHKKKVFTSNRRYFFQNFLWGVFRNFCSHSWPK